MQQLSTDMKFTLDLLKTVGKYSASVLGATFLYLILSPVAGYVPYSDRPGPGWQAKPFEIGWTGFYENATFMFSWILFLAMYVIPIGIVLFLIVRALEYFKVNYFVVGTISGLMATFLSGYFVLGIGWYIAIDSISVYVAAGAGLLAGTLFIPKIKPNAVAT